VTDEADVRAEFVSHRALQADERGRLTARADLGGAPELRDHSLEAIEPERVVAALEDCRTGSADAVLCGRNHRYHEHRHDRDRADPHQPPRALLERQQPADRSRSQHH
jgi:hypothetical protein